MTASSHSTARMFSAIVVAISLMTVVCANAAGTKAVASRKVERSKERKTYTSRSFQRETRPEVTVEKPTFQPEASGYHIYVDKSDRSMTIYMSGKPYRTYRTYLGFTPDGHKTRRGDGCTPEGDYYVCRRNAASAFYRSLLVSYPSPEDAKRGVEAGLIGYSTLGSVVSAYQRMASPPQGTRLGGNICIHGEGGRSRPPKDWTAGCMAVTNEEMTEIFSLIPVGTPVTIRP